MLVLLCPSNDSSEPSDVQVFNCTVVYLYICSIEGDGNRLDGR